NSQRIATTAFVNTAISSSSAPDATTSATGKIRLGGDLAGTGSTANAPVISDNAITSGKIADGTISNTDISNSASINFSKLNITKSDIVGLGIPGNVGSVND